MSRYLSPEGTSALESVRDHLRARDRPPCGGLGLHLGAGPRRGPPARGSGALLRPQRPVRRPRGLLPRGAGARVVQVPCGVRTQLRRISTVDEGSTALVEDGGVVFGDTEVLVTNIVDTTVPVLAPDVAALCGARLTTLVEGRLEAARTQLPAEALALLERADPAAADALLGVGPGMSPVGDDVLAGVAGRRDLEPSPRPAGRAQRRRADRPGSAPPRCRRRCSAAPPVARACRSSGPCCWGWPTTTTC